MKARFPKGVDTTKGPKKTPKNFICVNLPADEQAEMRAMASELGSTLRMWIKYAVHDARRNLTERVKLARRSGLDNDALRRLVAANVGN